jgi:DNA-binding NarL/FixJ family response regulator
VTILLVDDHQLLRQGLRALLERDGRLLVAGEAADGWEALELARKLRPDVVVMDISMPGLNGVDATRRIVAELPRTKIIALSMNADRQYVHAMFDAGASGYLLKTAASEELVAAVFAVERGEVYISPAIADLMVDRHRRRATPAPMRTVGELTGREREVLQLLSEGLSSKEIGARLEIASSTVESHRKQIMAKLDVHSVAELTKVAIRMGLTSLD